MKQTLITITLIHLIFSAFGNKITLNTNNGDWKYSSTWSSATLPQNGDTVVIPAGKTVVVSNDVYSTFPNIYVKDWGVISFQPSGKLTLGSNAAVEVFAGGSILTSGTNSERIYIANVLKYQGKTDGNISGYALANLSSGSSGAGVGSGFVTSILEVSLTDFKAIQSNNTVTIHWETASERDAAYFEVERSQDQVKWGVINTINATNSANGSNYSYIDLSPLKTDAYYRLKMVDNNGKVVYSEVSLVKYKSLTSSISAYPNPATNYVMVSVNQNSGNGTVSLSNFSGKTVVTKSFNNSNNIVKLDTQTLPNGIYVVEVTDSNNNIETSKVIIRK